MSAHHPLLNETAVYEFCKANDPVQFSAIKRHFSGLLGKESLSFQEKKILGAGIRLFEAEIAERDRNLEEEERLKVEGILREGVLIYTAYSTDYSIGYLCEDVNRQYAAKHGYEWRSDVIPYEDMLEVILPKKHPTWYKIKMALRLLEDEEMLRRKGIRYIMWIDADAMVINHEIKLETVISKCRGRDIIIAEDMHPTCLVNAGVIMFRVGEWTKELLQDMWEYSKYNEVVYFEQSTLLKCLRLRNEGLEEVIPFHSYMALKEGAKPVGKKQKVITVKKKRSGPYKPTPFCQDIVFFPHVAKLTHLDFNTNKGIVWEKKTNSWRAEEECAKFIFHAAGNCGNKLQLLRAVSSRFGVSPSEEVYEKVTDFRLDRTTLGLALPQKYLDARQAEKERMKEKGRMIEDPLKPWLKEEASGGDSNNAKASVGGGAEKHGDESEEKTPLVDGEEK